MELTNHQCIHEERFSSIERELTRLQAKSENKKEDIHNINKELLRDRQQQTELLEKVTKVTVLLEEGQEQRKMNNKKLAELEQKIDKLQTELSDNKTDVTKLTSSLNSFYKLIVVLIPTASIIVTVILHFINF